LNYYGDFASNLRFFRNNNPSNPMRLISALSSLLTGLILAGCVSVPAQQAVLADKPLAQAAESSASCNGETIVQNLQGAGISDSPGLDPDSISVLNWNIYKGQRDNWAADFRRYSDRHDVMTIQEAHLVDDLKSILDDDRKYWTLNAAFNYQDKATGVMTASRVKPVYSCGQRTVEPLIRLPKTSLISYYPVAGMNENLLVANVHGINFSLGVGAYKEQIGKLYSVIRNHTGPVVLAGDFNTWNDERMQIVDDLARRLSLESLDYTNHNRTSTFGNALDHVFYRGLEPVEQETWHVTSSDHNPTRVVFRVNRDAAVDNDLAAG
jgi:endonuclease/exonuclease/phosphatase (EEP) superfamily protein YafD